MSTPSETPWQRFLREGHPVEPLEPRSPWARFLRGEDPWADALVCTTDWPPASPWLESPWQAFRADA
jgi:hypothetical protein